LLGLAADVYDQLEEWQVRHDEQQQRPTTTRRIMPLPQFDTKVFQIILLLITGVRSIEGQYTRQNITLDTGQASQHDMNM
jgi:hypothetical protein